MLVKELQSLGLDIQVLDKDGNEIDLKQNDDEDGLDTLQLATDGRLHDERRRTVMPTTDDCCAWMTGL